MLLEISNLSKLYQSGGEEFYAVREVNFKASKGEMICVIGASGSGKSTLFNMITGLLKSTEGEIKIDNEDITMISFDEMARLRNQAIGYVFQGQNLLSNYTILDNICMPYYLSKRKDTITDRAIELLGEVGLVHLKNTYPHELSGGEMRRVAIARALVNKPSILIADEPTSNLDSDNSLNIMELFRSIAKKGVTVLVSTHDLRFLEYANKVYKMEKGKLEEYKQLH